MSAATTVFIVSVPTLISIIWQPVTKPSSDIAVANCLELIRRCQLSDGAIRNKADRDPIRIQPYFANHAALALLAGKQEADLPRVLSWLRWYAEKQRNGSVNIYSGSISAFTTKGYTDTGQSDSTVACAATYLLVVERYQRVAKNVPKEVMVAAKDSLNAINTTIDIDGLPWAKPDYRVKFLLANLEVNGGLILAERFFRTCGEESLASLARQLSHKLATTCLNYRRSEAAEYAYALDEEGKFILTATDVRQS